MTGKKWNKKVNSFKVKEFADQLSELKVPYFFITIGQGGGYYCSPNKTYEKHFGPGKGKLTKRDLVAELAKEHSKCPSGCNGGELGEFGPGQMVPEFDKVVFNEEVGKPHGPVKTDFGYHIVEITNRS